MDEDSPLDVEIGSPSDALDAAEPKPAEDDLGVTMDGPAESPWIRLYVPPGFEPPRLVPSPATRSWYTPNFYQCVPLIAADQLGWTVLSPEPFAAVWDGSPDRRGLRFSGVTRRYRGTIHLRSVFGHGIVTVMLCFYIRTSPRVDILVKGVPNWPKDGLCPLEGLVETDWFDGHFSANLRLTRPGQIVSWERGEPLCQLVPYPRGWLDRFRTETLTGGPDHAALIKSAKRWDEDRGALYKGRRDALRAGQRPPLDGQYRRGWRHDGLQAPATHRTRPKPPPFPEVDRARRDS